MSSPKSASSPECEAEAASSLLLLHSEGSFSTNVRAAAQASNPSIGRLPRRRQLPTKRTKQIIHKHHFPIGIPQKPRLPAAVPNAGSMYGIPKRQLEAGQLQSIMPVRAVTMDALPSSLTGDEALAPPRPHYPDSAIVKKTLEGNSQDAALSDPKIQKEEETALSSQYRPQDVLCGRDKISYNHPGNKKFQATISNNAKRYQSAPSRNDKTRITDEIIKSIRSSGGRFLRLDEETNIYEDVGDDYAHEKVSHALRSAKDPKRRAFPRKKRKTLRKPPTEHENRIFHVLYTEQQRIFKELVSNSAVASSPNKTRSKRDYS